MGHKNAKWLFARELGFGRTGHFPVHQATSQPLAASSPLPLTEESLVDVGDLLQADRFELVGPNVSFVRRGRDGQEQRWTGQFGDHLVFLAAGWSITSELVPETTWAPVA